MEFQASPFPDTVGHNDRAISSIAVIRSALAERTDLVHYVIQGETNTMFSAGFRYDGRHSVTYTQLTLPTILRL